MSSKTTCEYLLWYLEPSPCIQNHERTSSWRHLVMWLSSWRALQSREGWLTQCHTAPNRRLLTPQTIFISPCPDTFSSLISHTALLHLQHVSCYPRVYLTAIHNRSVGIGDLSHKDSFCTGRVEGDSPRVCANAQ